MERPCKPCRPTYREINTAEKDSTLPPFKMCYATLHLFSVCTCTLEVHSPCIYEGQHAYQQYAPMAVEGLCPFHFNAAQAEYAQQVYFATNTGPQEYHTFSAAVPQGFVFQGSPLQGHMHSSWQAIAPSPQSVPGLNALAPRDLDETDAQRRPHTHCSLSDTGPAT